MINLIVTDNKINEIENIIPITISNRTVELVAKIPLNSSVYLSTNIHGDYSIPMEFKEQLEDGYKFSCKLSFLNSQVQYLKEHPNKIIEFKVIINNDVLDGSFKCCIHPQLIETFYNKASIIKELQELYNKLQADIIKSKLTSPEFQPSEQEIKKGMVPVATGVGNEYCWDYPLNNLYNKLLSLSKLVLDLSAQNTELTIRIGELESKVNDHIYEQYQL